jgi:hypothetical protein
MLFPYVNGTKVLIAGPFTAVIAKLFVLLSINVYDWQVNKLVCVPVITEIFVPALCVADNGDVGTVKLPV